FSEYGLSDLNEDYTPSHRDKFNKIILDIIYKSAKRNKSGAGALVWQFLIGGMPEFKDDFGVVPWERTETYRLFIEQSCRLVKVNGWTQQDRSFQHFC